MPQVSVTAHVPCDPDLAFAVSQTTGAVRLRWDPFVREQHFLEGASVPDKGVRTFTRTRGRRHHGVVEVHLRDPAAVARPHR